jgi:hypothetical protein
LDKIFGRNLLSVFLLSGVSLWVQAAERKVVLDPVSRLWLEGTSTLHPFHCEAKSLSLTADEAGEEQDGLSGSVRTGKLQDLHLSMPVKGLKSGESGLDRNLYKAMDAGSFATVDFDLSGYVLEGRTLTAQGKLNIHGVSKPVTLSAEILDQEGGGLGLQGSYKLDMRDFGVVPPTLFFGTIRVGPEVKVSWNLKLEEASKP